MDIARRILLSRLDPSMVVKYYRQMPNRDIDPEQWDRQVIFWSEIIKKWGREGFIIDFKVDELSEALMYENLYPPIYGALDLLVQTKALTTKENCLRKQSIASKIIGFLWKSSARSDCYVFSSNLSEAAKQTLEDIKSRAGLVCDLCVTKPGLDGFSSSISLDLLASEFERMKSDVYCCDSGFFVYSKSFKTPPKEMIANILKIKGVLDHLNTQIQDMEETVTQKTSEARNYAKQGRRNQAASSLRRAKMAEKSLLQLQNMKHNLETQLENIGTGDINNMIAEHLRDVTGMMKPAVSVEDAEAVMDDLQDLLEEQKDLSAALSKPVANDVDPEIEMELNEMMKETSPVHRTAPRSRILLTE